MNYRKSVNVTFPHNYPSDGRDGIKLEKLIRTAWELGGTVYEVAKDAGLFSTYEFMESLFDDSVVPEPISKEDMTVVTEVYVRHLDTLERVFLASNRFPSDRKLLEIGNIDEGRLIISYDQLKYLHERGYSCFYQRSETTVGAISNRYKEVFGMDQKMIPFKMWDVYCTYVGSGYNQALLVRTMFETVLVMPDTYAVEQCVKIVYAEKMIQERFDPTFCIERIKIDSTVTKELESAYLQLFGISQMKGYTELPDSYLKLVDQFAYIKTYYPTVCDQIWVDHFRLDDEPRTVVDLDGEEGKQVILGISISENDGCYAMFEDRFGRIHRIPNMNFPAELPLFQKYKLRSCGDMRNAGVAASRLALNFYDIVTSAFFLFDVDAKDVIVTSKSQFPTVIQINNYISNRERFVENHGISKDEDVALIAYNESPFTSETSGNDIIDWAVELSELPKINLVERINAVVAAFEDFDSRIKKSMEFSTLQEQELGLIFEMSENRVELILFEKKGGDVFHEIVSASRPGIEIDTYYEDDELLEDSFNPNIDYVLCDELDGFMLDAGLRALGIYSNSGDNVDAYNELHKNAERVRVQLRRCDSAKVYFKNHYLEMTEDFPIERLEKLYQRLLDRNTIFLEKFFEENYYRMEKVSKIYAIGSEWEYPFVRKHFENIIGSKISYLAPFSCIEARGAAVIEKKRR